MESLPLGTIRTMKLFGRRRRSRVLMEIDDGVFVKSEVILSVVYHQKVIKTTHHGSYRNRWRRYTDYIWEHKTGSKIPVGYKIFHLDGDACNDAVDNLVLSRSVPFAAILKLRPQAERKRRLKQKAAVKRSNRRRHEELQAARKALFSPEAWYVILHGLDAVLWKPCESQRAAEKLAVSNELRDWLKRDGLATPESTEVIQGRDVAVLSGHDEPLERYRRFIPDERPVKPPKLTDLIQSLFDDYRSRGQDELPNASFMEDSRTMTPV
jgi:hypothetical protein